MDTTGRTWTLGLLALGTVLAARAADNTGLTDDKRVAWLAAVTDGVYSDAANWTGGELPANGADGKYGVISFQQNDVTVRAPAEGLVENSGTIFLGTGAGRHTLTLDTRGTFWRKTGVKSVNNWWCSPFAANVGGQHVFNFENCANNVANTDPVWEFADALFTWTSEAATRQTFDLLSGTFTFSKDLYLGSAGGTVDFFIHPGARLESGAWAAFRQRGNARTTTTVLGGRHTLADLMLKDGNADGGSTWFVLTNDAAVAVRGSLQLGARSDRFQNGLSHGLLDLFGTSRMEVTNAAYLGAGSEIFPNLRNQGTITLHDAATFYAHNETFVGRTQCATGIVTVAGGAAYLTRSTASGGGSVYLGVGSNAVGRLTVQDDGRFACGGVLKLGSGPYATGVMTVKDRGRVTCGLKTGNWLTLATGAESAFGRLEMADDAVLTLGDGACVEMTYGSAAARAEIALAGRARLEGGQSSYVTNKCPTAGAASISLADEAVLSMRAVFGAIPETEEAGLGLAADGGTLVAAGAGPLPVPYLSGCRATLGARGLTFDTGRHDVVIDQAFTAADGAPEATFTKTGPGTLTVRRDSDHPRTHVAAGRLAFAAGATRFGRRLSFARGVCLVLPEEGCLTADEIAFDGELCLMAPAASELGTPRAVLKLTTPLTGQQLARLVVVNGEDGKAYAFAGAEDGTVSLTVTEAVAGARTWTGAAGTSWHEAGNWDPAAVPTGGDDVTVAASATLAVADLAAVRSLAVGAGASVAVTGEGPIQVGAGVDVPEGASLDWAVPLLGVGGTFEKRGAGELTVRGDQGATMQSDWRLVGGRTVFTSGAALGADTTSAAALTLSNNTFRYTGEAAAVRRPVTLMGELPCVFDIVGDLTFRDFRMAFAQGDAGLVKTGAGTLTLQVPSGTTTLSVWKASPRKGNEDVKGVFAPSAAGEVANWDGAGQFSVLDGCVEIVGAGKAASTVKQEHQGSIGGSGWPSATAPELRLRDVTFVQGSNGGFHLLMDQQTVAGSKGACLVLDNADMTCNGLYVGFNKKNGNAETVRPSLAITNGTLDITWMLNIPSDGGGGMAPIVRVGAGGRIRRTGWTRSGGIRFGHTLDARFEDGGTLEVALPQCVYFDGSATGEVVFARGGGLTTSRFLALNGTTPAALVFDGGFAAFTQDGGISAGTPAATCLRADAGGGELRVGAGVSHALALPLAGTGTFTKTGAGTLVLTNDLAITASYDENWVQIFSFTETGVTTPKLVNAGGLVVAEGTVRCLPGTVPERTRVAGTGTLSGVFTSLTLAVEPGATEALTFADLTAQTVFVDFGVAANAAPLPVGTRTAVAHLDDAACFGAVAWKGGSVGAGRLVKFTCEGQTVVATVTSGGTMLILR